MDDPNGRKKQKRRRKLRGCLQSTLCAHGGKKLLERENRDHPRVSAKPFFWTILRKKKTVPLDDTPKSTANSDCSHEVLVVATRKKKGRKRLQFSCNIFPKGNCFACSGWSREIDEGGRGTHQADEMERRIGSTSPTQGPLTPLPDEEERCFTSTTSEASEEEDGNIINPLSGSRNLPCSWDPISTCLTNCMSPRCTIEDGSRCLVGISTVAIALLAMLAGGRSLAIACTGVWFYVLPTLRGPRNH